MDFNLSGTVDISSEDIYRFKFLDQFNGNTLSFEASYKLETSFVDILDKLVKCINIASSWNLQVKVSVLRSSTYAIVASSYSKNKKDDVLVAFINTNTRDSVGPSVVNKATYYVHLVGDHDLVLELEKELAKMIVSDSLSQITWWYKTDGRSQTTPVIIDRPYPVHKEFYPWLEMEPSEYFKKYLEDDASVLLLWGQPGRVKLRSSGHCSTRTI